MNPQEEIFRKRFLPLYPLLYRVAFGITGNSADASDAVQDAMEKIWAHGKTLADITSPKSFALTLTRNRAIDIVRRRTFSELTDNLANQEVDTTDTDSIAFLHTAISSLPPVQQKVLRLSTYGELSAAEIARIMNLTPENIRQLLSRSRKKLRELFKKNL